MFLIDCPWCGPRDQSEFKPGGEAHIARPAISAEMTDDAWADYVFMRRNPKGVHFERWAHVHGCRRWFNAARNTATDEFLAVYRMGEAPPAEVAALLPGTPCGEPVIGSGQVPVATEGVAGEAAEADPLADGAAVATLRREAGE